MQRLNVAGQVEQSMTCHIQIPRCQVKINKCYNYTSATNVDLYLKLTQGSILLDNQQQHYEYWLNYSIPVVLVLYNPESKLCVYEIIEKEKLIKTEKAWKVEIPLTNLLSTAADALRNIGQSEYQKRLSTLALSKQLMKLADEGELILEVLEWVNKSSGRGEFTLKRVDYNMVETILYERTAWGFGLKQIGRAHI